MAQAALSDEEARLAADTYLQCGRNAVHAANALGISRSTFRNRLNVAARRGLLGYGAVLPGFEIAKVSNTPKGDYVQQRPERNEEPFTLPENMRLDRATFQVGPNGTVERAWLKPKRETDEIDIANAIKESLAEHAGTSALYPPPAGADPSTFTVIPLVDWHVGLMAWARECGENYDLKIARDVILKAMAKVIAQSPASQKCIVLGLGDMLHFDGFEPVTSRSHNFLDADGRYPKVLKTAVGMIRATIDMALQKFEKVDVRILPGNHDDRATVALNVGFDMLYENNERVTFDDSPDRFWWRREGKVFLGATHGDKAKMRDLPLVMAHDNPKDWAKSTYRRIYTGHIHHESKIEEGGVIVTSMRSPVARDAYHSFEKYRAGRSVYSETFDLDGKMASSVTVNI